jgi:hypothetical protein
MLVAMLEKLLDDIIAKDVCHKLQGIEFDFSKNLLLFVTIGRFELLLDKARAMLITTKLDDMIVDVLSSQFKVFALSGDNHTLSS